MSRRFQFSLGNLLGSISLGCISLWLLRNPDVLTFVSLPFMVGAAGGQLFGRPLIGAAAVSGLVCAALIVAVTFIMVRSTGVEVLAFPIIVIGATSAWLTTLGAVRRWNARADNRADQ